MALSNWDLLAIDENGNSTNGIISNPEGGSVKIYKNWLYVHNDKMWHKGCGYIRDTICEIQEGNVKISGFEIEAKRCSQEGVMCYVECGDYNNPVRMAGIGCYGYNDPVPKLIKYFGINLEDYPDNVDIFDGFSSSPAAGGGREEKIVLTILGENIHKEFTTDRVEEFEAKYTGVQQETYQELVVWLESFLGGKYSRESTKEWLDKVRKLEPKRFNQGDEYFSKHLDVETPATKIGEQDKTILQKMCESK